MTLTFDDLLLAVAPYRNHIEDKVRTPVSSVQYLIGKTLGKYKVLEHIGHGGMSEVYLGQQAQLDRNVAIKVLHPFLADEEGFVVRFQREARIVATLRHPNIVQVYDFDHHDELDIYFMVMEFIDGATLKNRLAEGPLSPEETVRIGAAVADALDYAHRRSMVHRDIKPANIMFLDGHQPVLTDFGIAKMLTLSGLTASGAMVGTPAYMAPEIGTGKPGMSLSDIYSLSVVLYQTTTGVLPFTAETPMGMVMQHINKEPPSPSLYNPNIPDALEQIILRGLQKEPEKRFKDAREMAAALRGVIGLHNDSLAQEPRVSPPTTAQNATPKPMAAAIVHADSIGDKHGAMEEKPVTRRNVAPNSRPAPPAPKLSAGIEAEVGDAPTAIHAYQKPKSTLSERVKSRLWLVLRSILLLLIAIGIGGGLWLSRTGNLPPVLQRMISTTSSAARDIPETAPVVPTIMAAETPTEAQPDPTATQVPVPEVAAATPTTACALRVRLDAIDIQPEAVVSPGTSVVAYITVRNSGTCTWPQSTKMIFAGGDLLGAPETFPVAPLAPNEKIQFIVPMIAPEELGTYQTVWELRQDNGSPLGNSTSGRITIELVVADIPAVTFAPAVDFVFEKPTRTPLTVTTPTLLSWVSFPSRDLWTGEAIITATGGSGNYAYYRNQINKESELPGGNLSFEWRRCVPYPIKIWILSGEEILEWQSTIPYPDPDSCP